MNFPSYEARTWKSTGGHRVRENTTPALRLKCGLKAVMEKGRAALSGNCRLKCYIRMPQWKCITFFHTALSTLSKAPLLQSYKNTSRGEFDLCAFECDFQSPHYFSVVLLNITSPFLSIFLPRSPSDLLVTSHSRPLKYRRTRHTENISTQRGKSKTM